MVSSLGARLDSRPDEQESLATIATDQAQRDTVTESSLVIDDYHLLRKLGTGGMGQVWAARQVRPVKRDVALKLIRSEFLSPQFLGRFQAEQQALALMDHPNIARILDAGTSQSGHPYLVMELVIGRSVTEYCDQQRLSVEARLRMFVQICDGVQHAHQKGVIHRDLKPMNVIVGAVDGKAIPKIIDFGLAKALSAENRLAEASVLTGIGQILGTLKYMSPEQARLKNVDIDTRTDVYSLGVILYELLTGGTPLDDLACDNRSTFSLLELLQNHDTLRPSKLLGSRTAQQIAELTGRMQTSFTQLGKTLAGDLDWIVMKALEKDRSRRYATAAELASDIQRYLEGEPVSARPPSVVYQLQKYSRKYRNLFLSISLIFVTLCSSTIFSTYWAVIANREATRAAEEEARAVRESDRANKESLRSKQQAGIAEHRRTEIENSYRLLSSLFSDMDAHRSGAGKSSMINRLGDRILEITQQIDSANISDPLVRADLHAQLGRALLSFGRPLEAIEQLSEASDLMMYDVQVPTEELFEVKASLSTAYLDSGELDAAFALAAEIVEDARSQLASDHPKLLRYEANLATMKSVMDSESALPVAYDAWHALREMQGEMDSDTLTAQNNYAIALLNAKNYEPAASIFRDVLEKRELVIGADHIDTIGVMSSLASTLLYLEDAIAAKNLLLEASSRLSLQHSDNHAVAVSIKTNLAAAYSALGDNETAVATLREIYQGSLERFGPQAMPTWIALNNLAGEELELGNDQLAIEHYEVARKAIRESVGRKNLWYLGAMNNLVSAYEKTGKLELALMRLQENLSLRQEMLRPDHVDIFLTLRRVGRLHRNMGSPADALPYFERVYRQSPLAAELQDVGVEWFELFAKLNEHGPVVEALPDLLDDLEERCDGDTEALASQLGRVRQTLEENGIDITGSNVEARLLAHSREE